MSRRTPDSGRESPTPRHSSAGVEASTEHVYHGRRDPTAPVGEECTVTVDHEPLGYRYDLLSASPSGFEWGYRGSGPAQLAIALLVDVFNDESAVEHYQQFKREIVAKLPNEQWTLRTADIEAWRVVLDE